MSTSSTPGIRGPGNNTFFFPQSEQKQSESPKASAVQYPVGLSRRAKHRNRRNAGSPYDVRASYPQAHILRAKTSVPQPSATSSTLDDLLVKASVPKEDVGLLKMQEEERERMKDASLEGERWLWRTNLSNSDQESRWKTTKPATKQRRRSLAESTGKKEEPCQHMCESCGVRKRTRATRATRAQEFAQKIWRVLNSSSLLIVCVLSLALIPMASAAEMAVDEPSSGLYAFLFDTYPEYTTSSNSDVVTGYYGQTYLHTLLYPFSLLANFVPTMHLFSVTSGLCEFWQMFNSSAFLTFLSLLSIGTLISIPPFPTFCILFIAFDRSWGILVAWGLSMLILRTQIPRFILVVVLNICVYAIEELILTIYEWEIWGIILDFSDILVASMADAFLVALDWVVTTMVYHLSALGIWAALFRIWISDRVWGVKVVVSRMTGSVRFWILVALMIAGLNWAIVHRGDWLWQKSTLPRNISSQKEVWVSIS